MTTKTKPESKKPPERLALRTKERSKERSKKKAAPEPEPSQEIPGLALLSAVLISGIALLSESVRGDAANLLGPYLGKWWAQALNQSLGALPVLFYLGAFGVVGLQLLLKKNWWRPALILALMGFFLGLLLSIPHLRDAVLTPAAYQLSGGWIGNFLCRRLYLPLFRTGQFGPYLVTWLLIFFLVVWGFKLSVTALLAHTAGVAGSVGRSLADGWRRGKKAPEAKSAASSAAPAKRTVKPAPPAPALPLPEEGDSPEEEKAKLEALLDRGDLEGLDPIIIRKIRDLAIERKRVNELNEWEQKVRHPEIAGMLGADPKAKIPERPEPRTQRLAASETEIDPPAEEEDFSGPAPAKRKPARRKTPAAEAPAGEAQAFPADLPAVPAAPEVHYDPYHLPDLDGIFETPPEQPLEFTEEELREQSKMLEAQLINFKVMGKVTQICPGPVITRYEVELAPGVKVNRISNLADDLALALKAKSIRILAPIPGKSVVGIEVPNRKAQIVYIKEILSAREFQTEDDMLKIGLGKTIGGDPYVIELSRAPHLLIAGQTGSGKSVCINSIMASLLATKTPDELRLILVDPKVVELKPYDAIPHLLHPVITQPDVAVQALKWSTVEMDRRYGVLAQAGVRNIKGFNQKFREGTLPEILLEEDRKLMPVILIVIDELADLMMVAGKEVETQIARIAQKARAIGIHLILATQRPSTNVITGTIKANLPTRIAFQVASQIDARTILDRQGAEKLLGRGDMLYKSIDFPEPVRLHGCYIDDDQCEKIAGACSAQFVNYPQVTSFNLDEAAGGAGLEEEERDEKFREAAELVVQLKQASVSLLQRRLGLGYARSGRLVDQLERAGIVGRERGSKPREVLMGEEELFSFLNSNRAVDEA